LLPLQRLQIFLQVYPLQFHRLCRV
jgi:hypothetical protein